MAHWRTRPARDRRQPAGFIKPCVAVLKRTVPAGEGWTHELKWDGYRIIARRVGEDVQLWSRTGTNWTATLPRIAAALRKLRVKSVAIDGEAVALREDGYADFHALLTKRGRADALLMAFDLLELNGEDLRKLPLRERRARLQRLLAKAGDALVLSAAFDDGAALLRRACEMNFEGIVSKRVEAPYVAGPFDGWRKVKCPDYQRSRESSGSAARRP